MRLFILERTPLGELHRLPDPPRNGDAVAFMRTAQDLDGGLAKDLKKRGITAFRAGGIVDFETSLEIERIGAAFITQWFLDDGEDISQLKDLSLGKMFTRELSRNTNPRLMIRYGETVRRILEKYPDAQKIISDLTDGGTVIKVQDRFQPVRDIIRHVAAQRGRDLEFIDSIAPVPPSFFRNPLHQSTAIFKRFLGGMRLRWLGRRLRWRFHARQKDRRPVLYVFMSRSSKKIAAILSSRGNFQVITSQLNAQIPDTIRYDHLFAFPTLNDFRTARRTLRYLNVAVADGENRDAFVLNGIDYGRFLYRAVLETLSEQIYETLFIIAQTRKLQKVSDFSSVLIDASGISPMGFLIEMNRQTQRRIYFGSHGINVFMWTLKTTAHNNPHVTYLACGDDHRAEYGVHLPENEKPRRLTTGSPVAAIMKPIRGKRPKDHGKRLLILGFANIEYQNSARVYAVDVYLADVFTVARDLLKEGWEITFRAHPHHPLNLEKLIIEQLGISDSVHFDHRPDVADTLLVHDAVVSNITSVYYQALYAGWPTIFYEPDYLSCDDENILFRKQWYVGLPAATDIDRPVATNREGLGRLIRETMDPKSKTATFPERFVGEYAKRFLGPEPDRAEHLIADILEQDVFKARSNNSDSKDAR